MARPEISKTGLSERLRSLRGDVDRGEWARDLDCSKGSIGNYERGDRVPDATFLAKLALKGFDVQWIVSGERSQRGTAQDYSQFSFVPNLGSEASVGNGAAALAEYSSCMLAFKSEWLSWRGISPSAAAILIAKGDGMEPTIRAGDTLLIDTSIDRVRDDGIYVVAINGMVVVKRIHTARDGSVSLLSDNAAYPAEAVPAYEVDELMFAGRVMWFGRAI
jgi:phage repressor protein C with HTH and peptisase S24 domain